MDIPARQSYVMAVVSSEERPAAASVTNVPRSLASAISPIFSGYLLSISTFGWPLVIAGTLKGTYDLLLLSMFRFVKPPEEHDPPSGRSHPTPTANEISGSKDMVGIPLPTRDDS
jgi:hypothetical protein